MTDQTAWFYIIVIAALIAVSVFLWFDTPARAERRHDKAIAAYAEKLKKERLAKTASK